MTDNRELPKVSDTELLDLFSPNSRGQRDQHAQHDDGTSNREGRDNDNEGFDDGFDPEKEELIARFSGALEQLSDFGPTLVRINSMFCKNMTTRQIDEIKRQARNATNDLKESWLCLQHKQVSLNELPWSDCAYIMGRLEGMRVSTKLEFEAFMSNTEAKEEEILNLSEILDSNPDELRATVLKLRKTRDLMITLCENSGLRPNQVEKLILQGAVVMESKPREVIRAPSPEAEEPILDYEESVNGDTGNGEEMGESFNLTERANPQHTPRNLNDSISDLTLFQTPAMPSLQTPMPMPQLDTASRGSPSRSSHVTPKTRRHRGMPSFSIENPRADEDVVGNGLGMGNAGNQVLMSLGLANSLMNALPPIEKFSLRRPETFGDFVESVQMRFIPGYTDAQKITLFRCYLADDSKAAFDLLSSAIRRGTFTNAVREFRKEFEAPLKLKKLHWQRELSMYVKKNGLPISVICKEIENLGKKAYPSDDEVVVRETQQCAALLRCLEEKPGFFQYIDASMTADDETMSSYSSVKQLALRHDSYVKGSPNNSSGSGRNGHPSGSSRGSHLSFSSNRGKPRNPVHRATSSSFSSGNRRPTEQTRQGRSDQPRRPPQNTSSSHASGSKQYSGSQNGIECFECGRKGHKKVDCPTRRTDAIVGKQQVEQCNRRWLPQGFFDESDVAEATNGSEGSSRRLVEMMSIAELGFRNTTRAEELQDKQLTNCSPPTLEVRSEVFGSRKFPFTDATFQQDEGLSKCARFKHSLAEDTVDVQDLSVQSEGRLCAAEDAQPRETNVPKLEQILEVPSHTPTGSVLEMRPIVLPVGEDNFLVEQLILNGIVAYMETEITIDTGASISLVSTGFLKKAHADQEVSAKMCKERTEYEKGSPEDFGVLDASRNLMQLVGKCKLPTKVGDGVLTRVAFHVIKRESPMVLLGMNALRSVGLRISLFCPEGESTVNISESARIFPGCSRILPVRGKRNSTLMISKCPPLVEENVVVQTDKHGNAFLRISNNTDTLISVKKNDTLKADDGIDSIEWDEVEMHPTFKEEERDEISEAKLLCEALLRLPEYQQSTQRPPKSTLEEILSILREGGMPSGDILKDLVSEFQDIFATRDEELGSTETIEHVIDTGDCRPIRQRARPIPLALQAQVRKMLEAMKSQGVIRQSNSPWASPVVLVRKKDGSIRMCVDYRKINEVMKHDAQPLPNMDLTLQSFAGKRFFSTFDLLSGFWQVPMKDGSKSKTAFAILDGLYEFEKMPYGLANSPATFQRMMHIVLQDILGENVFVYVDDVIVASETWEEHLLHLRQVFERLREHGLRLKAQKCRIGQKEVHFLGHVLSDQGMSVDPDKIARIENCKRPTSLSELRTFLGMTGYYRKFIHNFSRTAGPLYDLTASTTKWNWGEAQEKAFLALKKSLCSAPVLGQPDVEKARDGSRPFVIYVDASKLGIGAVLCQEDAEGRLHPLHFMSERLNNAQKNYHPTDLEALAVKRSLAKFRQYIYGLQVTVRTDHQALVSLMKRPNLSERTMRWALEIQDENVKIEYVKGSMNKVADALSRGPVVLSELTETSREGGLDRIVSELVTAEKDSWTLTLENDDGYKKFLKDFKEERWEADVRLESTEGFKVSDFAVVEEKVFIFDKDGRMKRWVPEKHRREVWNAAHDSRLGGHCAPEVVLNKVTPEYFWPEMRKHFKAWHRECVKCLTGNPTTKNVPPLHPRISPAPFHTVAVDLIDMGHPSLNGNRYLLSVIDHFTKFGYCEALPSKEASVVCSALFGYFLRECRVPQIVVSDQGSEFLNDIVKTACEELSIEWQYSKGYIKRETGLVERYNRSIQQILRKIVAVETEWDTLLPYALYCYNTATHSATGDSPVFLASGRDPRVVLKGVSPRKLNLNMVDVQTYRTDLLAGLQIAYECTKENLQKNADNMKTYFDKKRPKNSENIVEGDRVILMEQNAKHKMGNKHSGPYRVVKVQKTSVVLKDLTTDKPEFPVQLEHVKRVPKEVGDFDLGIKTGRQSKTVKKTNPEKAVVPVRRSARIKQRCELIAFRDDRIVIEFIDPLHPAYEHSGVTIGKLSKFVGIEPVDTLLDASIKTTANVLNFLAGASNGINQYQLITILEAPASPWSTLVIQKMIEAYLSWKLINADDYVQYLSKGVVIPGEDSYTRLLENYIKEQREAPVVVLRKTSHIQLEDAMMARRLQQQKRKDEVNMLAQEAFEAVEVHSLGDRLLLEAIKSNFDFAAQYRHIETIGAGILYQRLGDISARYTWERSKTRVILVQVGYMDTGNSSKLLGALHSLRNKIHRSVTIIVVPSLKNASTDHVQICRMETFLEKLVSYGIVVRYPHLNSNERYTSTLYNVHSAYHRCEKPSQTLATEYFKFVAADDNLLRSFLRKKKPMASEVRKSERRTRSPKADHRRRPSIHDRVSTQSVKINKKSRGRASI